MGALYRGRFETMVGRADPAVHGDGTNRGYTEWVSTLAKIAEGLLLVGLALPETGTLVADDLEGEQSKSLEKLEPPHQEDESPPVIGRKDLLFMTKERGDLGALVSRAWERQSKPQKGCNAAGRAAALLQSSNVIILPSLQSNHGPVNLGIVPRRQSREAIGEGCLRTPRATRWESYPSKLIVCHDLGCEIIQVVMIFGNHHQVQSVPCGRGIVGF
ncbi:hypothetical protein MLD38_031286 [Melastoma candidum]|uniref:Uncharacterized protein n=1 Tax=Melastoma candidum TaxID=119954 RepID=A0ACB9MU28_9MYRT|nr:hypothetical protein MLD38_031286 [Melastoma candidum]